MMPVQVMWLYGHAPIEIAAIWHKLTWLNVLVLTGLLINMVLLWQVSPSLKFSIPILLGLVTLNNFIVGHQAVNYTQMEAALATLGFTIVNLPMLDTRVLWILRHPDRRWWRRATRHQVALPLLIEGTRLNSIRTESFDLSESGLFIGGSSGLGVGDWVNIKISFDSVLHIRTRARVVRRSEARGTYPAGVGVEFVDLPWSDRQALKRGLQRASPDLDPDGV